MDSYAETSLIPIEINELPTKFFVSSLKEFLLFGSEDKIVNHYLEKDETGKNLGNVLIEVQGKEAARAVLKMHKMVRLDGTDTLRLHLPNSHLEIPRRNNHR